MAVRKINARRKQIGRLVSKLIRETTTQKERTESARKAANARWTKWRAAHSPVNALLIAAAPDLLGAVHKVSPQVDSDSDPIT